MAKLVLLLAVIIGILIASRRLRAIIFHVRVRQFFTIFFVLIVLFLFGGLGYAAWKYWWPVYMKQPTVLIQDTTLEHDLDPETPGIGGAQKSPEIQIR